MASNAANLALFMVNLTAVVLADIHQTDPQCSVLDLKARCRGSKYITELIKLLPEQPNADLMAQLVQRVTQLGRIHPPEPQRTAA
jgi:putative transposase